MKGLQPTLDMVTTQAVAGSWELGKHVIMYLLYYQV